MFDMNHGCIFQCRDVESYLLINIVYFEARQMRIRSHRRYMDLALETGTSVKPQGDTGCTTDALLKIGANARGRLELSGAKA